MIRSTVFAALLGMQRSKHKMARSRCLNG
jgi:hypothetical protein